MPVSFFARHTHPQITHTKLTTCAHAQLFKLTVALGAPKSVYVHAQTNELVCAVACLVHAAAAVSLCVHVCVRVCVHLYTLDCVMLPAGIVTAMGFSSRAFT
eukprot:scaffold237069_cov19-Tisochrysis_lutea.AAC.2